MMNAYQKIMGEVTRKSIPFSGVSREVYILCDFENQENCITEIQIEIY
jgi:effector-binding domain-containing protein